MLDLHLFLGRPLKLASQNTNEEDTDSVVGSVPQALVDDEESFIRSSFENSHDLVSSACSTYKAEVCMAYRKLFAFECY